MSITATVENDTIKLPSGVHIPDGTKVRVELDDAAEAKPLAWMEKFVGAIDSLPPDAAARHTELAHGRKSRLPE
jgi:hypothetical protein